MTTSVDSVVYFVNCFPVLRDLKDKLDKVYNEYIDYQSLPVSAPADEANACGGDISAEDPIDTFWNKLS